jgi:protein N-terminal methyltransferase
MSTWYSVAADYWLKQPSTVDGVLGGFSRLSGTDIAGSRRFLDTLSKQKRSFQRNSVLDCGGGIGRVTADLLLPFGFRTVDLLEPSENLLSEARRSLTGRVRSFLDIPLQQWRPDTCSPPYDVIWAQWVLLYLTDEDLLTFFTLAASVLNPEGGVLVLKENVASGDHSVLDAEDNSVTRTVAEYRRIAALANLEIVLEMKQPMWPSDLFPVVMMALVPK